MFIRSVCKKQALDSLKGKWKIAVLAELIMLVSVLLMACPYFITFLKLPEMMASYTDPALVSIMILGKIFLSMMPIWLFIIFLFPPLTYGLSKIIVQISNNVEDVKISTLFSGFKEYGKSMGIFWWFALWIFLWELAFYFPIMIITMILLFSVAVSGVWNIAIFPAVFVIEFILIISMIAFLVYKEIRYGFIYYAAIDDPEIGAIKAMNISKEITKGKAGSIFVLELSFLGWILLTTVTLGIAGLWIGPYLACSQYNAYKVLRDECYKKPEMIEEEQK